MGPHWNEAATGKVRDAYYICGTDSEEVVEGGHSGTRQVQAPMGLFVPRNIPWTAGPVSLRPGTKMAVFEGDPTRAPVLPLSPARGPELIPTRQAANLQR